MILCYNGLMCLYDLKRVGLSLNGKTILKAIDLQVSEGERLTVTGPSGSGKSSLLKVLGTLVSHSQGKIIYDGDDLKGLDTIAYRQEVAYCFQQPVLFGKTVLDNLTFPFAIRQQKLDTAKVVRALEKVNLSENYLNQAITDLSGGEKQRVALVRHLLFEPRVLLLDEVTSGLDKVTKQTVHQLLQHYHSQGHTLIEVTHDQEEIAAANRLITIEEGSLQHG